MSNTMVAFWMGAVFSFGATGSLFANRLEDKQFQLTMGIIVWVGLLLSAPFSPLATGLYVGFYVIKVLSTLTYSMH